MLHTYALILMLLYIRLHYILNDSFIMKLTINMTEFSENGRNAKKQEYTEYKNTCTPTHVCLGKLKVNWILGVMYSE